MAECREPTVEGTSFMVVTLPGPGKPREPIVVAQVEAGVSALEIVYTPEGRLRASVWARVARADPPSAELVSCPLTVQGPRAILLTVVWQLPDRFEVAINAHPVASFDPGCAVLESLTISDVKTDRRTAEDFSTENIAAAKDRYQRLVGHQPVLRRTKASNECMLSALRDEAMQLRDLISLAKNGAVHHIPGIGSRLRLLIAEGKPLPLLQHCAAAYGIPLVFYTDHHPRWRVPLTPDLQLIRNFSATPQPLLDNPIDIDVWLKLQAGTLSGKDFTHRQLIMATGNTVASHVSADLHELVVAARRFHSGISRTYNVQDYLRVYVLDLADCASALAEGVLEQIDRNGA
jgi:hypothetical protein